MSKSVRKGRKIRRKSTQKTFRKSSRNTRKSVRKSRKSKKSIRKSKKSIRKSKKSVRKSRKSKKSVRKSRKSKKSVRKSRKSKKSVRKSRKSVKKIPVIILQKSKVATKKLDAIIGDTTVSFGAKGYLDYTIHKDEERMHRYENRHKSRENWSKSGIETAGFWSKWILWNKPSLIGSIKDTEKRFNIKIINKIK